MCVFPHILSLRKRRLTRRSVSKCVIFSHLGFQRVKTDGEVQKILDGKDKVPAADRLRAVDPSPKQVRCQDFKGHVKISQKQIPIEASSGVSRFFTESTGNALFQQVSASDLFT